MLRWLLIIALVATIPFLIHSGLRHRLRYALSLTATIYLVLIVLRVLTGFDLFWEEFENTIGVIAIVVFVALVGYALLRYYAERRVQRKLRQRQDHSEAHRSLIDILRRTPRS